MLFVGIPHPKRSGEDTKMEAKKPKLSGLEDAAENMSVEEPEAESHAIVQAKLETEIAKRDAVQNALFTLGEDDSPSHKIMQEKLFVLDVSIRVLQQKPQAATPMEEEAWANQVEAEKPL